MANTRHVLAYIGITVLVTWLANGLIPELQAGTIPIPDTWAWLVRSVVPALVVLTILLPSVVQRPPGVPDTTTTNVTVTPPTLMAGQNSAEEFAKSLASARDKAMLSQTRSQLPGTPTPTAPAPAPAAPIGAPNEAVPASTGGTAVQAAGPPQTT